MVALGDNPQYQVSTENCQNGKGYRSMAKSMYLCLLAFIQVTATWCSKSVSFYGQSYLRVPMEVSRINDALRVTLQFKVHRPRGLLVLVTDNVAYLAAELISAQIEVTLEHAYGEKIVLNSDWTPQLYDTKWHNLEIRLYNANLTLVVDEIVNSVTVSENIDRVKHVFLGGTGDSLEFFYKRFVGYRGCLRDIVLNGVDVINKAESATVTTGVGDVSWICDEIFDIENNQPISFLQHSSFVTFDWQTRAATRLIEFEVKTRTRYAFIMYTNVNNIIAQLVKGQLKVSIGTGRYGVTIMPLSDISDGKWHSVRIQQEGSVLDVTVDSVQMRKPVYSSHKNQAIRYGYLHMGAMTKEMWMKSGVDGPLRRSAFTRYQSLLGCVRDIRLDSRLVSFRHIENSRNVSSKCDWVYSCTQAQCGAGSHCVESGVARGVSNCLCDHGPWDRLGNCVVAGESTKRGYNKIIDFKPLAVSEGGQAMLTMSNIYGGVLDPSLSAVVSVFQGPRHGQFYVRTQTKEFTLRDVRYGKVIYIHDGSDTFVDSVTVRITINENTKQPIDILSGVIRTLPIVIRPTNDPPRIVLVNKTLQVLRNRKCKITSYYLRVVDPDTPVVNLTYTVYSSSPRNGYFEKTGAPGTSLKRFTQDNIDSGQVWFVHQGAWMSYIRIQASDGYSNSRPVDVKVVATELKLSVDVNTGITVTYRGQSSIFRYNLSSVVNVENSDISVRYVIVAAPVNGEMQVRRSAKWVKATAFTQKDVDAGSVRFVQRQGDVLNCSDVITFTVSAKTSEINNNQLRVICTPLLIDVSVSDMKLKDEREQNLLTEHVRIRLNSDVVERRNIYLVLIKPPSFGNLYKYGVEVPEGASFTLEDVEQERVSYVITKGVSANVEDRVKLRVETDGARPVEVTLKILCTRTTQITRITNRGLRNVVEGHSMVITKGDLFVYDQKKRNVRYEVIIPPEHGVLCIQDPVSPICCEKNIASFSNDDITRGVLMYEHDDSENSIDSFTHVPKMIADGKSPLNSYSFPIYIKMRNDNKPVRIVNKTFNVVKNQEHVISIGDLQYHDADIDFDSDDLVYTWRGLTIGKIVRTNGKTLTRFTQRDLIDRQVTLQHTNMYVIREQFEIHVTDGKYVTRSLFEVEAVEPYLHFENNTGLNIAHGQEAKISPLNLSIASNVDLSTNTVVFRVKQTPGHGSIRLRDIVVDSFTLSDIESESVTYRHNKASHLDDSFVLTASVLHIFADVKVSVHVISDVQTQPPRVMNNHVLVIENGSTTVITSNHLQISHPDTSTNEIVYIVTIPAKYGFLVLKSKNDLVGVRSTLKFTQFDINSGRVSYRNNKTVSISDRLTFSVATEHSSLQYIDFFIEIISEYIPLSVHNFTVVEGQRSQIPDIKTSERFNDQNLQFEVTVQPKHGYISDGSGKHRPTAQFTPERAVFYIHDDTETTEDHFTIVARVRNKTSEPAVIYVVITPVNDETPRITHNKALLVWKGSVTLITRASLSTQDADTPTGGVVYKISPPTNGHVALVTNKFRPIRSFTQKLIDNKKIAFIHKGGPNGFFTFQVTDGVNSGAYHRFNILAQPLLLTLERFSTLRVYPNSRRVIGADCLSASTNDVNESRAIVYHVTRTPQHGSIVTGDEQSQEVYSFTQLDVNSGRIVYEHSSHISTWSQDDHFLFDVTTSYAESIVNRVFMIHVAYMNLDEDHRRRFISVAKISVIEGREVVITKTHLDITAYVLELRKVRPAVRVVYKVTKMPESGWLLLSERKLSLDGTFTQENVNRGDVKYTHDDSDIAVDDFSFNLVIFSDTGHSHDVDIQESMNISVVSRNDEPFILVTKNPGLTVVEGQVANITKEILLVTDRDSPPYDLVYTVTNGPISGHIAATDEPSTIVGSFTQADIDEDRLVFVHNGGVKNDSFWFSVTDGAFDPEHAQFRIHVIPLDISITNILTITLVQAQSSTTITNEAITMVTNGRHNDVLYNITTHPQYGKVQLSKEVVSAFTQSDLDRNLLRYVQTNMKFGRDRLVFHAFKGALVTPQHILDIIVVPLVTLSPLSAPAGSRVALTLLELDASELAAITGDNPVYTITSQPRWGSLVRVAVMKRDLSRSRKYRQVSEFSHEDIIYGKIFYVSDRSINATGHDNFSFILTAYNVQPARGHFTISLTSPDEYDIDFDTDFTPLYTTTVDYSFNKSFTTNKTHTINSAQTPTDPEHEHHDDTFVLVVAVCSVLALLIGVIAVVLIIVIWRRRRGDTRTKSAPVVVKVKPVISGPLHLVHIEERRSLRADDDKAFALDSPTSGIPIRRGHDLHHYENVGASRAKAHGHQNMRGDQLHADTSPIPVCKVTPLVSVRSPARDVSESKSDEQSLYMQSIDDDWTLFDPEMMEHLSGVVLTQSSLQSS